MGPEVLEKSQRAPTADGRPFSSVRHYELDERPVADEGAGTLVSGDWRSMDALRDRRLLMIDNDSVVAGGSEPTVSAKPRAPYSERPVARARRAKAQELVKRLITEGCIRIAAPDDNAVAEWRRVVNYAKRHGLEPEGKRIEKLPHGGPGLELFLAEGPHPNARSQRPKEDGGLVPVPTRLGHLHPMVAALKDDERRLVMPSALRRRSLLLLQGRLRWSGEGTRFGRQGRPSIRARAEWTSLSMASRTPSPSDRSSRSPQIRSAPFVSSWSWPMA